MKFKHLILGAMFSAVGMQAHAAGTHSVAFDYSADMAKQTVFKVRLIGNQLQLMNPNVSMKLGSGTVLCEKGYNYTAGELYLGYATANGGSLNKNQTFASDWTINPSNGNVGGIVEAGETLAFDLAVNSIKNNYFSPVGIVEAEKTKFVQGGGTEVDFLKQTRLFKVDRAVTLAGKCTKNGGGDYKVATKMVDFMVEYQGSPNAMAPGNNQVLAPKKLLAVPLGSNGTVNAPFTIQNGTIDAVNGENWSGSCPSNEMFKVVLNGTGHGQAQIHVKRYGQPVYTSQALDFNGPQLVHHFPITAEPVNKQAGQVENLHFMLSYRTRANANEPWGEYKQTGGFSWAMKCLLANQQNLAPQPMKPARTPAKDLQAVPQTPPPATPKFQATPQTPPPPVTPKLQLAPVNPTPTPSQPQRAQ